MKPLKTVWKLHVANRNNLLTFIWRYFAVFVGFFVFLVLAITPQPYAIFGTFLYFPLFAFKVVLAALLMRFLFFRKTLDDDAYSGYFIKNWKKLDAKTRILASLGFVAVLILAFSILASAMIR